MIIYLGFTISVSCGEGQLSITTSAQINFKNNTAGLLGKTASFAIYWVCDLKQ